MCAGESRPPGAQFPARGEEVIGLVDDLLRHGHDVRLHVTGRSMAPWLEDGALVTLRRVGAAALTPGDLLLFRTREGRAILHRFVRLDRLPDGTACFLLKGDSCAAADERVLEEQIVGKVTVAPRGGSRDGAAGTWREGVVHRLGRRALAYFSLRSPRLYHSLSRRLLPLWRRLASSVTWR